MLSETKGIMRSIGTFDTNDEIVTHIALHPVCIALPALWVSVCVRCAGVCVCVCVLSLSNYLAVCVAQDEKQVACSVGPRSFVFGLEGQSECVASFVKFRNVVFSDAQFFVFGGVFRAD